MDANAADDYDGANAMTIYDRFRNRPEPLSRNHVTNYYCIVIASDSMRRTWSCIALRHKPSESYIACFDQVMTFARPNVKVYVLVQGDALTPRFLQRLAASYIDQPDCWQRVDLTLSGKE